MKPYYNEPPLWNNELRSQSYYSDFIFSLSSLCISFIKLPFSFLPIDLATNSQMSFYSRIPNNSRPLLWPHSVSHSWFKVSAVWAHGHIIFIISSLFSLIVVFSLSLMPSHSETYHPQSLGQLLRLAFKASPAERPNVSISSVCMCVFVCTCVMRINAACTIFSICAALPETSMPVCHTKGPDIFTSKLISVLW